MKPEEFYEQICSIADKYKYNEEVLHYKMDNLICEVLEELGYDEMCENF